LAWPIVTCAEDVAHIVDVVAAPAERTHIELVALVVEGAAAAAAAVVVVDVVDTDAVAVDVAAGVVAAGVVADVAADADTNTCSRCSGGAHWFVECYIHS
jgi:hypothetical protein